MLQVTSTALPDTTFLQTKDNNWIDIEFDLLNLNYLLPKKCNNGIY